MSAFPLSGRGKPQSQAAVKPRVNVSSSEVHPLKAAFKSYAKTDTVVRICLIAIINIKSKVNCRRYI